MRIIAGSARGRRLSAPPGRDTRPTSDRVREALFSAVESRHGSLSGARVLDLYAGSGALGLEALSRGAAHVLLVESDARALRTLRANVAAVARPGARPLHADVGRVLAAGPDRPYDLVLADPPYELGSADVGGVLESLRDHGWLAPSALVVVERPTRGDGTAWPEGYEPAGDRRYGETTLWYGRPAL
ncbi:MAG TPA: 16S rRNA (guanine(966)-N(2))-methyltransferase RsmD [Jiangellales bacterium]|nr:16S rRNA (guanine(966)-N(2))-methyltransferase RsmD [Jiangellales bacterium]